MEDAFDTQSQTSTVYTHESRIFSHVSESLLADGSNTCLSIKLEPLDSPSSPNLLPDEENINEIGMENRNNQHVTGGHIEVKDKHCSFLCLKRSNKSSSNAAENFNSNGPEATWAGQEAFINMASPWSQRTSEEKKLLGSFFADVLHKVTDDSPLHLILQIILELKNLDIPTLISLINDDHQTHPFVRNSHVSNDDLPSLNQSFSGNEEEAVTSKDNQVEEWIRTTSLSSSIVSLTSNGNDREPTVPQLEGTLNGNTTLHSSHAQISDSSIEILDIRNQEKTPEKALAESTPNKTPKKKASEYIPIASPIKRIRTRLDFENSGERKNRSHVDDDSNSISNDNPIQKTTPARAIDRIKKPSKKKPIAKSKVDLLKELIPDSNKFKSNTEFLESFSFTKTCHSSISSKTCSLCEPKDGILFEMFYFQYDNASESVEEHYFFCPSCFVIFTQISDNKQKTIYQMILELAGNGVISQYKAMLSNGNVRFRIKSRKRWFEKIKSNLEGYKDDFDILFPLEKNQTGLLLDVVATNKIKDAIRDWGSQYMKLSFDCYLYEKFSKARYKFKIKEVSKENEVQSISNTSLNNEQHTSNKRQTSLRSYFQPL